VETAIVTTEAREGRLRKSKKENQKYDGRKKFQTSKNRPRFRAEASLGAAPSLAPVPVLSRWQRRKPTQ
jgi:hypothetical protein